LFIRYGKENPEEPVTLSSQDDLMCMEKCDKKVTCITIVDSCGFEDFLR